MTKLNGWTAVVLSLLCAATAITAPAQTFSTLVNFAGPNGGLPSAAPIQGRDGNLYGTTEEGGGNGSLYRTTFAGVLDSFALGSGDGQPIAGLTLGTDGNFCRTSSNGGTGWGSIFKVTAGAKLTTLYDFSASGGNGPLSALIEGPDGNFYGTTAYGGSGVCLAPPKITGCGTVFRITPDGQFTSIADFENSNGASPVGALLQSGGYFYGTAFAGGNRNDDCNYSTCGVIFRFNLSGHLETLYKFNFVDGSGPWGGLVLGTDGNLYGVTSYGGNTSCGSGKVGCGTIFKIDIAGELTTLYKFSGPDGFEPFGGLIQATDGNLYGTTSAGGTTEQGTVFQITPAGVFTTLHTFHVTDGDDPYAGLFQATNGILYGTTFSGGQYSNDRDCNDATCGTIFSLNMGLSPFVAFVGAAGKVGQTGGILGQGFTGTTAVSLNGIAMNFMVVSDTFLTATVPPGATTGYVTVTTPTGVLTSNVPFHVIP